MRRIAAGAARAAALGRAAARDPVGQLHRARAARARRDARGRAVRPARARLLAAGARLRHAAPDRRTASSPASCSPPRAPRSSARSPPCCRRARSWSRRRRRPRRCARRRSRSSPHTARRPPSTTRTQRVGPDTIAKILYTSGSTGRPKGVINTQRMLCSNQEMLRGRAPVPGRGAAGAVRLAALEPHGRRQPQLRHSCSTTAARSTSTRAARCPAPSTRRSGTCARSPPRRTSPYRARTRCCCRTCAPTPVLRERFFAQLKMFFYAAAGLDPAGVRRAHGDGGRDLRRGDPLGDGHGRHRDGALRALHRPRRRLGRLPRLPRRRASSSSSRPSARSWRRACAGRTSRRATGGTTALTQRGLRRARASIGSATPCASSTPGDPAKGLVFDGRLAEDFKLSTGTWVGVGAAARADPGARGRLRAGRRDRRAMTGRSSRRSCSRTCRCAAACAPSSGRGLRRGRVLDDPRVVAVFRGALEALARESTGSSTLVARAVLLDAAAVDRRPRGHRQGLAQPEGRARQPRRARRRALRRPAALLT